MDFDRRTLLGMPLAVLPVAPASAAVTDRTLILHSVFHVTKKQWQAYYCDRLRHTQMWMDVSFAEAMLLEPLIGKATITVPLYD